MSRNMTLSASENDIEIAPRSDRPVAPPRELVPVTQLISRTTVAVINGILTTIRVLKAA
jgi:hypothetical protein